MYIFIFFIFTCLFFIFISCNDKNKNNTKFAINKISPCEWSPCSLLNVKWWWRDVWEWAENKKTSISRRRGLFQGYHEYEHWLRHTIISKLLAVSWRMRGLDRADLTCLNHWPLPPTVLRLSTYESCAAKDHLTITPVSMTQDQGGCSEKEQREGKKYLIYCRQSVLK